MRGVGNEAVKIDTGATRTHRDRFLQCGDAFVPINKADSIKRKSSFRVKSPSKKSSKDILACN